MVSLSTTSFASDWTLLPLLTAGETYNDNVFLAPKGQAQADAITTISPGFTLSDQGARVRLSLTYDPQEMIFARGTASNQFQQRLQEAGNAELLKDTLFLDLNSSIDQEFVNTAGPVAATTLTASNNLQTVKTFNASPYLVHHFGDVADTETRYRFSMVDTGDPTIAPNQITEFTQKITSGQYFGRLGWTILGDLQRIDRLRGNEDPLAGTSSKDEVGRVDLKYPVYQALSLVGGVGYERVSDPTLEVQPNGIIWNGGFQYQPNPQTSLTVTYGKRLGSTDIEASATYKPSEQLQLHAGYTKTLQTGESLVAANVNQFVVGPNGTVVNAQTGLPVVAGNTPFGFGSSAFGLSSLSFIDKRAYVDAQWVRGRNTYLVSAYDDRQTGQAITGSEHAIGGAASWARQLWPTLTGNIGGSYTKISGNGNLGNSNYYAVNLALNYSVSPTAVVQFAVTRSDQQSTIATNSVTDDLVTISLRKTF